MSVKCSRTFTLSEAVTPTPDVYAYFKCDEVAGSGIVDSVSAYTLVKSTVAFPTEPGFIGTSVRIGAYPADPFFKAAKYQASVADKIYWDFSTSWTIRLWANVSGDDTWLAAALDTPDQFRLMWLNTGNVEFRALLSGSWETITSPMADSAWHRVIAWYELGVGLGLKIDNNASATVANTDLIGSGQQRFYVGGPIGYGTPPVGFSTIDEIGIWKRLLTDAEMLTDWNSGAGKTYPDVP